MPDNSVDFIKQITDFAWFLELALIALSWVILRYSNKKRVRWYRLVLEYMGLFAVFAIANAVLVLVTYPKYSFSIAWVLIMGLISLGYISRFSDYERTTSRLLWLALYTSDLSIASMAGQSSLLLGMAGATGSPEGMIRILMYTLIPVVALVLRKYNFDEYPVVPKSGMRMLLYGTICVLVLYVVEAKIISADSRIFVTLLVAYACMFTMTMAAIRSMHIICKEQSELLDLQAEKQRFLAEKEMTHMTESKLEDLRCIRHDLKNQYSYMQILLEEGRYGDLQAYFAKLAQNLPEQLNMIDCGNRTMSTVLNMEMAKLRSDRIFFEHQLVVPPVLPFPDEDICSIVTNLLDNAADECRRLLKKGRSSVKVRIEIYPNKSYLYIKVCNTTDRKQLDRSKGGIRTTKKDEQMHGYGTRIVMKLAEKYNGCADYSLADGQFIAQVMLDMTEDSKK